MHDICKTSFTRLIEKQEERLLLRVPFEVAQDIESITISYAYTRHRTSSAAGGKTYRQEVNIVDLALEDAAHVLVGASGSRRSEITIHENYATDGYRGVSITPGIWYIILGAYKIEAEGCPVDITIVQKKKQTLLLKGDCHTHTVHSDGWYTVEELISRAQQDRLDFLFLADHNSMASNAFIRSSPSLTILPGVEATYYDGHCNLLGVARPIKTYVANSHEDILAILHEAKQNGALISLNHPIDPDCSWLLGFGEEVPADMVEIWNGPFTPWNQKSIDMWHGQLCKGRIWPAIGGSDCHHAELFRTFATPATCLYARSRASSDILDAMKKGHAYIGMNPDAPSIYMEMGDARMGDVAADFSELLLRVGSLQTGDEIRLINQTGVIWKETAEACFSYETTHRITDSLFVRAEVRRQLPGIGQTLASIGNPIYIR